MKISEFIDAEITKVEERGGHVPDELSEIVGKVAVEYGTVCTYECIGGYDSPGYDLTCYAIAYIEDGALVIYGYNHELY